MRGLPHGTRVPSKKTGTQLFCNNVKVSEVGRARAISSFRDALREDNNLLVLLWTLSGHCQLPQHCHGDVQIEEFRRAFPDAYEKRSEQQTNFEHDSTILAKIITVTNKK